MSTIKEHNDQCNFNDEYTTKVIDTNTSQKLREVINFKNEEKQIRHHRIRAENYLKRKYFSFIISITRGSQRRR